MFDDEQMPDEHEEETEAERNFRIGMEEISRRSAAMAGNSPSLRHPSAARPPLAKADEDDAETKHR